MKHTLALASFVALLCAGSVFGEVAATDGWRPYAAREEIAPRSWTERDAQGVLLLGLAGRGDDGVDGRWAREVPVVPGKTYGFGAAYRARDVASPSRSVLARLVWLDAAGETMRPMEYPLVGLSGADGWTPVAGVYRAPETAARARLELHLRWTTAGEVVWRDAAFREATLPGPRRVTLAAVNHRPRGTTSPQDSRERFVRLVEEAAAKGADIVCLPEGITTIGNGLAYAQAAESVPGPSTAFLGDLAKRLKVWIVAGIYERDGARIYNTAVLIARDGSLAGRYRKMSLPDEEIEGGITPGSETPVFETDFGRVGLMICWDSSYPEVAHALAERGAEVILMPIAGGVEALVQARAIENQVHVVASGYDFRTGIFDRKGERIADAKVDPEVVVATVDLALPVLWPWVGNWRARVPREAPEWSTTR
ncbi:MAG TPA: carbon-nitrogen hydrolase family protein [Vicinamibacteria bacterium]|nr:carbon-nitrogen hydrolase family protein [Vicinamibacteria bacterium]